MSSVDRDRSRAGRRTWPVKFYRAADGSQPADGFIDAQPRQAQAMIDNYLGRLALFGPSRRSPSPPERRRESRPVTLTRLINVDMFGAPREATP